MAEIIFILVTVYAVYVVHSVVTCNQRKKAEVLASKTPVLNTKKPVKKEKIKVVVEQKKSTVKKTTPVKAKTKLPDGSLRNPETGEVSKIASSYRMTKRWIKEALVTEGLLEKIYKTDEINTAAKAKINKALDKLAKMDKYQ